MENMKVEVVLKQTIKPSTQTPLHSKTFNLSFLDQHLGPPIYIPFTLYYESGDVNNKNNHCDGYKNNLEEACEHRVSVIKQSLSETLARYYPLAGRMKEDNLAVECNDEGVEYFETRVSDVRLSQVIKRSPNHNSVLRKFLPPCISSCDNSMSIPFDYGFKSKTLLAIQVNIFECGGIVIGMCMAHRLADASTMFTFITDWAATARGAIEDIKGPSFDFLHSLPAERSLHGFGSSKIRLKLLQLRVWGVVYSYLRSRITPPLPANSFGNIYTFTIALSTPSDENDIDDGLRKDVSSPNDLNLVGKVRDAIKKIDDKYTRKLQSSEDELVNDVKPLTSGEAIFLGFSSWCRFPIYEADFGWGKPTWVSIGTMALRNTVFLMDTKSGDGIEAFVNMAKEDMDNFEVKLLADQ
ncbi:salutaridinol 7-O-acetyltransferase-like [Papaver somniferum]|uniref:salutaridinol 7-O-acetyltransferase-like n=1 Tax=Papaver somniferum TaxID=3469 RepID=UPI000E6FE535|nr:salutaridinol 7-O-acetyltransferase-like [Papaver somniferum]